MSESITLRFSLHAAAKDIYDAWLDSARHSAMTGERATASREIGSAFTAWSGYITGKNLLLIPNKKIVQSWRSSEFPEDAPDSVLSIQLVENQGITEIELEHKDIPSGQAVQYQAGWVEYYANPMQRYFAAGEKSGSKQRAKKPAPRVATGRAKPLRKPAAAAVKKAKKAAKPAAAPKKTRKPKKKVAATKPTSRKSGKRR